MRTRHWRKSSVPVGLIAGIAAALAAACGTLVNAGVVDAAAQAAGDG
ncbi:hypothetical protein ACFV4E_13100 [Streptomyces hygroscopicus]|nr:hypothetical protein [Streptomyces sp. NBRC 109436]